MPAIKYIFFCHILNKWQEWKCLLESGEHATSKCTLHYSAHFNYLHINRWLIHLCNYATFTVHIIFSAACLKYSLEWKMLPIKVLDPTEVFFTFCVQMCCPIFEKTSYNWFEHQNTYIGHKPKWNVPDNFQCRHSVKKILSKSGE